MGAACQGVGAGRGEARRCRGPGRYSVGPRRGCERESPTPILGRSPDVAGGLPEITRQREEAKAAAERLVPETWDENAQCGKRKESRGSHQKGREDGGRCGEKEAKSDED